MTDADFQVRFESAAEKQIRKQDRQNQHRILAAVNLLRRNPRPPKATQLVGHDQLWRVRVGDYRVIYVVEDAALTILVVRVGHRRDVYDF